MQIEERQVGEIMILDLKGKITLGEGDEVLKDKINSLILQNKKRILLNLADVPYIDSAGLGEIVRTYTTVSRQGGQLKLVNCSRCSRRSTSSRTQSRVSPRRSSS